MFDATEDVLVPCVDVGLGTDTATVLNVTTGEALRITGVGKLTLVNRVACVSLPAVTKKGRRALVRLSDDLEVWVRAVTAPVAKAGG